LNLLGKREPDVYGADTFENFFSELAKGLPKVELSYFQSNIEGELIDSIQEYGFSSQGIILNAGAFTHTSIGLGDAISAIKIPVIEVHITNIYAREEYRHHSFLTGKCVGVISGFGLEGYKMAVNYLLTTN
jgi:3-dehydroquinate dehydratase-2